jgi:hypothetical protein
MPMNGLRIRIWLRDRGISPMALPEEMLGQVRR